MTQVFAAANATELDLPAWVWYLTIGIAVAVLVFDVIWIARNPHRPSTKELVVALSVYIGAAVAFGIGLFIMKGGKLAGEFYAGWLTEYSLSIDNLFHLPADHGELRSPSALPAVRVDDRHHHRHHPARPVHLGGHR